MVAVKEPSNIVQRLTATDPTSSPSESRWQICAVMPSVLRSSSRMQNFL
jgi:hypothetical protein